MNTLTQANTLLLVGYSDVINEKGTNHGFKESYIKKEEIPVLLIFSNFPKNDETYIQMLKGNIRTYIEEKKGIIFYHAVMKETIMKFIYESAKTEGVGIGFSTYTEIKYDDDYLKQIVNKCFSIKNIKLKEVIKMAQKNEQTKISHLEMIEKIAPKEKDGESKNEDERELINEDLTCFIMEKKQKDIIKALNLDQKPSQKINESFEYLVKETAFKTRFFDLFSGQNSAPDRIKRLYEGKNWKFQSLLILYSNRHKRVFIHDLPESALFLNAPDTTFMELNTRYSLISQNYETKSAQKITITKNNITDKFDILIGDKQTDRSDFKRDIMTTFKDCTGLVNQLLQMITHTQSNEYRFFYNEMAVVLKISGSKYLIESYKAK